MLNWSLSIVNVITTATDWTATLPEWETHMRYAYKINNFALSKSVILSEL